MPDILNNPQSTVAERIRATRNRLAPAELAVVTALFENYPTAGLGPLSQLAGSANVSSPTVLRLITKLGFNGYGAFQESLRGEVQAKIFSPVDVYPNDGADAGALSLGEVKRLYIEGIHSTVNNLDSAELDAAIRALSDNQRNLVVMGGRFSSVLATQLVVYLKMLRPNVTSVQPESGPQLAALLDINEHSTAVVFDYRRYQHSSVDWGKHAVARGAQLILVTDQYLSPLAHHADILLTTSVQGLGPFDSMAHGFSLVELLISRVAAHIGEPAKLRLAEFERLQLEEEQQHRKR